MQNSKKNYLYHNGASGRKPSFTNYTLKQAYTQKQQNFSQ